MLERWKKLDDEILVSSFTFLSYFGSMLMSILFMHRVWFKRVRISKLIHITRIPLCSAQNTFLKWKLMSMIIKILFISIITYILYTTLTSLMNTLKNDDCQVLQKKIGLIVDSHVVTFYWATRLEVILVFVTCFLMGKSIKVELGLTNGNIFKGLEIYQNLLWKISHINKTFGNYFLAYYLDVIGYCIGVPSILLSYSHVPQYPSMFFVSFVLDTTGWIVAAEFYYSIQNTFLKWHEHHSRNKSYIYSTINLSSSCDMCEQVAKSLNAIRLLLVRDDVAKNKTEFQYEPLALSCRFFRITYEFLKTVSDFYIFKYCQFVMKDSIDEFDMHH